jgi:hypothetical protein
MQDRQKIFVDKGKNKKEFKVGDHVFLKVKSKRSSFNFGNYSEFMIIHCGPFEILERIGHVVYMLSLLESMCIHNVFHVSLLKNCVVGANHVIDCNVIQVEQEGDFQFELVCILDWQVKLLHNRAIGMVNVHGPITVLKMQRGNMRMACRRSICIFLNNFE